MAKKTKAVPPDRNPRAWYPKTMRLTGAQLDMVDAMRSALGANFGEFMRYLVMQEWKSWRAPPVRK